MSGLYQPVKGTFAIIPPTTDEIEDFFEQRVHYSNAVKHLAPIGPKVSVEQYFESPHLIVMINGEMTRVNPISFGHDALLCVVVMDEDRLFFFMEAHTDPIVRNGEEDDSILITTWRMRPGVLFGTDVGDMHFLTPKARAELVYRLVQLS